MLTYLPVERRQSEAVREHSWAWLLLSFAWLWVGVFGHDLWNPIEPKLFAVIRETSQNSWWLPLFFGQPYFEVAPVYVWVAMVCQKLLSPHFVDVYSASRFATVWFTVWGLMGCGMTAFRLFGAYHGRSTVLLLIGSVGLFGMGHFLNGVSVAFAGVGLCLWGLAEADKRWGWALLLLGVGLCLLGQALGWLLPVGVILTVLALLCGEAWRGWRLGVVVLGASLLALALSSIWWLIWAVAFPEAWAVYKNDFFFGAFGGWRDFRLAWQLPYYLKNLVWFAFPALPLAVWAVGYLKLGRQRGGLLMVWWLGVLGTILAVCPQAFQDNLIVLLPVLAILGAVRLDTLRWQVARWLNGFGVSVFGLLAVFLWVWFVAAHFGFPAKLAQRTVYFSPFYVPNVNATSVVVAGLFTLAWWFAITRKRIRGRQSVTNWTAGMTLVWVLIMTLLLGWVDSAKSYRPVVERMERALLADNPLAKCVEVQGESNQNMAMAWREYARKTPLGQGCSHQIVRLNANQNVQGHRVLWQGGRPRHKQEQFALIKKP